MKSEYKTASPIIAGTLVLTITGLISKVIGFFYRIFLSNTIGEEGMGIYQLVFPVMGICMAICALSFQTAISRFVAAETAKDSKGRQSRYLQAGLILTLFLSLLLAACIYMAAAPIARYILLEERCESLLKIVALSLPFSSIHACVCGYYYGKQQAAIPAFSQLAEQLVRVLSVWLIWQICLQRGNRLTPAGVMGGLFLSEIASVLFLVICYLLTEKNRKKNPEKRAMHLALAEPMKQILCMAIPLTANRLLINVLQSAEAIMIPSRLQLFGLTTAQALSVYGVLTGMAMPFIFFPSTLTNSAAVMLLPAIAKAQSHDKGYQIQKAAGINIRFCLWLGILCTGIFVLFGDGMGILIFDSELAGTYITILAWLCPFLYLTTTMASILNGMGFTSTTLLHNIIALSVRLAFVVFLIPRLGIIAYLWGALLSELMLALLHLIALKRQVGFPFSAFRCIVQPVLFMLLSGGAAKALESVLISRFSSAPLIPLCLSILFMAVLFAFFTALTLFPFSSEEAGQK